jgi:Viral coat protein P2 N-terminal domain
MSFVNLPNINNAAIGAVGASIILPVGESYNSVQLFITGATDVQVKNIRVQANGKTFQTFKDLAELKALNAYFGRAQSGNYATIWAERPELTRSERRLTAWGTADIKKLVILFDVDAGAAGPFVITARADTSINQPMGLITKIVSHPVPVTAAGELVVDNIPRFGMIAAMHFGKPDVDNIRLIRDRVEEIDSNKVDLQEFQKAYDRVPQTATFTHIDFTMKGYLSESFEVQQYAAANGQPEKPVQDVRAHVEVGAVGTGQLRLITEYIDSLSGS